MIDYNHAKTSEVRKSFLLNGNIVRGTVKPAITNSWIRSRNLFVDPSMATLPPLTNPEETAKLVTDYSHYIKDSFKDYFTSKHNLLEKLGIAIYYVHESMTIHIRAGNKKLTNELKSINLGFGANLAESSIGTNAVALAAKTNQESWVIGAEHYTEALQEYVCAAIPLVGPYGRATYVMLIAPLKDFNSTLYNVFRFMLCTEVSFTGGQSTSDNFIKTQFINNRTEENNELLLIIDPEERIISANASFFNTFNTDYLDVIGKPLISILPELKDTISCLKTGKGFSLREIKFGTLRPINNNFFVTCKPVEKDNKKLGIIITMTTNEYVQKIIHTVINYSARFTFEDLMGSNPNFVETKSFAYKASQGTSNVLILGESGTGKELFAHAIHNASSRNKKPFVSVNCASIPKELIASELFGYVEGAFTGARKGGAQGKFQLANGGTLFLDEIGEMPLDMQTILLRALENKTIIRLGDSNPMVVDVRLIAATNQNLRNLVNEGKFRLDLFYRLNVVKLEMIPLRERAEDIPMLVRHFLSYFSNSLGRETYTISEEAINILQSYHWPGNVRELRNVIERGFNFANANQITAADLPQDIISYASAKLTGMGQLQTRETIISNLKSNYAFHEKEIIQSLMAEHGGNKSQVAAKLGIARTTLYRKLKYYGLSD